MIGVGQASVSAFPEHVFLFVVISHFVLLSPHKNFIHFSFISKYKLMHWKKIYQHWTEWDQMGIDQCPTTHSDALLLRWEVWFLCRIYECTPNYPTHLYLLVRIPPSVMVFFYLKTYVCSSSRLSWCRFRNCLKLARTQAADIVGNLFFNVINIPCFVFSKEAVCTARNWWGRWTKDKNEN